MASHVKRGAKVKSNIAGMATRLAEAIGNALPDVLGVKTELAIANNQRRRAMFYSERDREIKCLS